ncbi:CatB-related O-acetyltransferase [bacterium]|nr:CatB-related O-acetyltransferase [bacterium]
MNLKLLIAKGLKILLNPPALRNCDIDKTSKVCAKSELTRVAMDRYSYVGNACFMVNVQIGAFCSIADRCCIGGAMHPIERVSSSPVFHEGSNILRKNFQKFPAVSTPKTVIENDVWIGMGSYIKSGVTIHSGAVIGMGSVVTHDVPAYEIWAGNPAKLIRKRFDEETVKKLLELKWWDWPDEKLEKYGQYFSSPEKLFEMLK